MAPSVFFYGEDGVMNTNAEDAGEIIQLIGSLLRKQAEKSSLK